MKRRVDSKEAPVRTLRLGDWDIWNAIDELPERVRRRAADRSEKLTKWELQYRVRQESACFLIWELGRELFDPALETPLEASIPSETFKNYFPEFIVSPYTIWGLRSGPSSLYPGPIFYSNRPSKKNRVSAIVPKGNLQPRVRAWLELSERERSMFVRSACRPSFRCYAPQTDEDVKLLRKSLEYDITRWRCSNRGAKQDIPFIGPYDGGRIIVIDPTAWKCAPKSVIESFLCAQTKGHSVKSNGKINYLACLKALSMFRLASSNSRNKALIIASGAKNIEMKDLTKNPACWSAHWAEPCRGHLTKMRSWFPNFKYPKSWLREITPK